MNTDIFEIGSRLRVLTHKKAEYVGILASSADGVIILKVKIAPNWTKEKAIRECDIAKIRMAEPGEDLDSVPYFDAEEKEFWRTHWYTRDGIKEKSPEDIKMLEEFHEKWG